MCGQGDIARLIAGPQRVLSAADLEAEAARLLAVVAAEGVKAVLPDVCTCRELLVRLAEDCHAAGHTAAGQYLDYLADPSH